MNPVSQHALAEVVIDLDAIAHNVRTFVRAAAPAQVMVIIKADAYNHGMLPVARTAIAAGAAQLGVATVGEALSLRELGVNEPVTAWMWYPGEELESALSQGVTIGIPSLAHAEDVVRQIDALPGELNVQPQVTLMFDSGLSRSGVGPKEWTRTVDLLAEAERSGTLQVTGLMTHLASADMTAEAHVTDLQVARFNEAIELCRAQGIRAPINHMANTPATLSRPDTHHQMVRPGVGVYGVDPVDPPVQAGLRPAMTLRARVLTTRVVPAGEGVSYGLTWRAEKDTRTAVIGIGYADGIPRSLSGNFEVSINGTRYPQIGRVCMDQFVVNLGDVDAEPAPHVAPGDWAVIFGDSGPTVEEVAERADTIAYEILTMPRGRVQRRYVEAPGVDFSGASSAVANTAEEMRALGEQLGKTLKAGTVVVLTGALGAGKTTLTQGIAQGLGVRGRVQSPTFTIVRTHKPGEPGAPGLLHMDAYRLLGEDVAESIEPGTYADPDAVLDALESLDLDADLQETVVVAEWGRGVVEQLSDAVLDITLTRGDGEDEARTLAWEWVRGGPQS